MGGRWIAVVMCVGCFGSATRTPSESRAQEKAAVAPPAESFGPTVFSKGQIDVEIAEVGPKEPIDVRIRIRGLTRRVDVELALTGPGIDELAFTTLEPPGFQGCDPVHSASEC